MEIVLEIIVTIILICWVLCFIQSTRMLYLFRRKYPEIARKEIAHAFDFYAHPEKLFYFFREKNNQFLKDDIEVWNIREQVKLLAIISIALPLLIALIVLILIVR